MVGRGADRLTPTVRAVVPGVLLLVLVALLAWLVAVAVFPSANELVLAIVLGALLANLVGLPRWAEPGAETYRRWLELGIVLMGTQITLATVFDVGPRLVVLVLGSVAFGLVVAELLSRRVFGLEDTLGSLLAAGMSICGVSAVVAVAEGIRAEKEHVAYAVATVFVFDAVTLVLYPIVGSAFGFSDRAFGLWAGTSMLSTGPVAAAGFAYSQAAGQWAVMTKLTRNVLIGGVVVAYAMRYTSQSAQAGRFRHFREAFPTFVLGFVGMIVLANSGLLSDAQLSSLSAAYHACFLVAFSGLGLCIDVRSMRGAGWRPVGAALATLCALSVFSLLAIRTLFGV